MPKARKDPNKPKGVKSAYIFFVEQQRADRESSGQQLPFAELSKKCGIMWGDMSVEEKSGYVKLSVKDKKRHEHEMESYIPPPSTGGSGTDSDDGGATKKKKKTKDPNAPKRPITAYFYFAADKRPGIREQNSSLAITQIATIIGKQWRNLTNDDKVPYEEQAIKDKARYISELAVYNQGKNH